MRRTVAIALLFLAACGDSLPENCQVYFADGSCSEEVPPPVVPPRSSCDNISCLEARSPDEVCEAYIEAIADDPDIPFTPGALGCDPGALAPQGLDSAVRAANFGRWLAGLPPVALDPALTEATQACARMMAVQRQLSHFPGPDWACFSQAGREAASKSNIALGYLPREHSVASNVMSFFKDLGANNLDGVGHRRWLQSPQLGAVGYGLHVAGTDVGSCFNVTSNRAASASGPEYIAYPNPGPVPFAMLQSADTPWSVAVDVPSGASWPSAGEIQVRVDRLFDGGVTEIETEHINVSTDRVGYTYAVVFLAKWRGSAGRYRVRIEGLPVEVDYETDIRPCTPFGR